MLPPKGRLVLLWADLTSEQPDPTYLLLLRAGGNIPSFTWHSQKWVLKIRLHWDGRKTISNILKKIPWCEDDWTIPIASFIVCRIISQVSMRKCLFSTLHYNSSFTLSNNSGNNNNNDCHRQWASHVPTELQGLFHVLTQPPQSKKLTHTFSHTF